MIGVGGCIKSVGQRLKQILQKRQIYILALLAGLVIYIAGVFVPFLSGTELIGIRSVWESGAVTVKRVFAASPAASADVRVGDRITGQAGRAVTDWHRAYTLDKDRYFQEWNALRGQVVSYTISRNGQSLAIDVSARRLTAIDLFRLYGIRIVLLAMISGLALVIVLSGTREPGAFLICLCFIVTGFWLFSAAPYWHAFFSPLLVDINSPVFVVLLGVGFLALQMVTSLLLHIALVFPERRSVLQDHRWLRPLIYLLPVIVLSIWVLWSGGSAAERFASVIGPRQFLNTVMLVLTVGTMLHSYHRSESTLQREQSRWLIVSFVAAVVLLILFWNLPALLLGRQLIPDFDWVLIPFALVPISMTVAIIRHRLLGVRRIIRRRIHLLQDLLQREKASVKRRNHRIEELIEEIGQLNAELDSYIADEAARTSTDLPSSLSLTHLEKRYPEIKAIRSERLLGVSARWDRVFEEMAIAAQGAAPVMIVGESGTGKTDIAWSIYRLSDRRERTYKAISCSQFEHGDPAIALGRFFGIGPGHGLANVPKDGQVGLLEQSDHGTLFLDDFDRLPLNVQDLLLYPLEGKSFEPGIGGGPTKHVSVKFLLATNQDPERLVANGELRGDVLARMNSRVDIPALRERPEDIPVLIEHFRPLLCDELAHEISEISHKAMNLLTHYDYQHGNARELRSELQKAIGKAMLEDDPVLRAGYLSEHLQTAGPMGLASTDRDTRRTTTPEVTRSREHGVQHHDEPHELMVLRKHRFQIKPSEQELGLSHKSRTLSNHFRGLCIEAMYRHDWDIDQAARSLAGVDDLRLLASLKRKIERFFNNIEDSVRDHHEQKLYNNLPTRYRRALDQAIERVPTGNHG